MIKTFCVVLLLACVALGANAQCFPGETQDVCKYGTTALVPPPGTNAFEQCAQVNENPFSVNPIFGQIELTASECSTAIREDGDRCIRFYAELQCSAACKRCATIVCPKFCDNHDSVCPTATDLGCFDFVTCASEGQSCTDWDVSNNLPSPIATTSSSTTRTTTATTSRTGTGTGTTTADSSDAASISAGAAMVIFVLAMFFA